MTRKALVAVAVTSLALRLCFIFIGFPTVAERWHLREDGDGYGVIAQTIRDGHYVDVTRGPVYPSLVAKVGSLQAVKVIQAGLDTLTCVLLCALARSWWPALLWAIYPFAIWRTAFINKEIVLTFLLVSYARLQILALQEDRLPRWLGAGVLLGIVNLCKPTFLLWPVVLLLFARRRAWWTIATMLVVILSWTYRNYRITGGEFLPIATEAGGLSTFVGNYQPTDGLWEGPGKMRWLAAVDEIRKENTGASIVALDRAYYRAAWQQVESNPAKALGLALRKCGRFWFLSAARREQLVSVAVQLGYMALLVIGLWRLWPWNRDEGVMLALIGYVMLVHAASYADLRFSLPVMPFVCVLASRTFATRAAAPATS